jgi:hypothetical protein
MMKEKEKPDCAEDAVELDVIKQSKSGSNKPRRPRNQAVPDNDWRPDSSGPELHRCGWQAGDLDHDGWRVDKEKIGLVDLNDRDNLIKFLDVALISLDFIHSFSRVTEPGTDKLHVISAEERIIRKYGLRRTEPKRRPWSEGINEV